MKVLFITPPSHEPQMIVDAWDSFNEPAMRLRFDPWADSHPDDLMLRTAKEVDPEIIFYVGANKASGLPSLETFRKMRKHSKVVHLCWDAADDGWADALKIYHENKCFDLQVAMDGGRGPYIDISTLTPIDPRPYRVEVSDRNIRCAFAGQNVVEKAKYQTFQHPRYDILKPLVDGGWVEHRARDDSDYASYAAYLMGCKMLLNISHTGSGLSHHVKLRVAEAGHAGCCLLEMRDAPTTDFIPDGGMLLYGSVEEAIDIIGDVSDEEIEHRAMVLKTHIMANYSAETIYDSILDAL